jgi:hypothetical protein
MKPQKFTIEMSKDTSGPWVTVEIVIASSAEEATQSIQKWSDGLNHIRVRKTGSKEVSAKKAAG